MEEQRKRVAFVIGDVVALKSGGPAMTVVERTADGIVCRWVSGRPEKECREMTVPDVAVTYATPGLIWGY